jgi:hypothetical protein
MQILRQGDVMLIRCEQPVDLKDASKEKPVRGYHVLADGEATGHAHRVAQTMAVVWATTAARFLEVKAQTMLEHEEHGKIGLEPGFYQVVRQQEYTPERVRNVAD